MNKQIFAGHSQLPSGTDLYERGKYISVLMVIDVDTGEIIESGVPLYCSMHSDFVSSIVNGRHIESELEQILLDIETKVHTQTRRALITAIQALVNRYSVVKGRTEKSVVSDKSP
jgi:hypothetical protein